MQAGPSTMVEAASDEWSGEAYEEDKAGAFLKFSAQVQQVPQSCMRYRYASQPMQCHILSTRSVAGCLQLFAKSDTPQHLNKECNAKTVFYVTAMSPTSAEYMYMICISSTKLC